MDRDKILFAKSVYDASDNTDVAPLFNASQACLETGWGKSKVGIYNLWGIKATSAWHGKRILVTTTEYLYKKPYLLDGESIVSSTKLSTGKIKFVIKLWFRDYDSLHDAIVDHNVVLKNFPQAWQYRHDPIAFVKALQSGTKKYATDPNYVSNMLAMYSTLNKLGFK